MSFDDYRKRSVRLMHLENLFLKVKHLINVSGDGSRMDAIDQAYEEIIMTCNSIDKLPPPDAGAMEQ